MFEWLKIWRYSKKLRSTNPFSRLAAVRFFRELEDPRRFEFLVMALDDSDRDVRRLTAEALGRLGDVRAVEPLVKALKDGECQVRQATATALRKLGDRQAVEPLLELLRCAEDDRVLCAAAEALGRLGDARAIQGLSRALALKYESAGVSSAVAGALARLEDKRATRQLVDALAWRGKHTWHARKAAAEALLSLIGPRQDLISRDAWQEIVTQSMAGHGDRHQDGHADIRSASCGHTDYPSEPHYDSGGIGLPLPTTGLACPTCGTRLKAPTYLVGFTGCCPRCKKSFQIPSKPRSETNVKGDF